MSSSPQLHTLSAVEVISRLRDGSFTVEEYANGLLKRVQSRDSTVKAWAYLDAKLILNQAQALDRIPRSQRGPLHGVAVGIKDVFDTEDMPTQYGSSLYTNNQPSLDSAPVAILRQAGALIFGKTTTSEFTFPNNGPETTNPHNKNHTPGGSSAGSAAAVADFQVPLSIGTQTGGSVIRPASYTGIWAMKPSFGSISLEGVKPCAPSLDTVGFFARNVEDLQLINNVFSVKDDEMPQDVPLHRLKVAFIKTPQWPKAGPCTMAAIAKAAKILREYDVAVEEVEFPDEFNDATEFSQMTEAIICCESQISFLKDYCIDKAKLHPENQKLVENAGNYNHKQKLQSLDKIARLRTFVSQFTEQYSVLITPSAPDIAPEGIDDFGPATFNTIWTALHLPVVNIPAFGEGPNNMPVGLSFVAGMFRDQHLLAISKVLGELLMAEGGWKITPPSSQ